MLAMAKPVAENKLKKSKRIKWNILFGVLIIHIGAIFGFFTFTWEAFWVFLVLQLVTGLLGITLCYHRLLTHRSFKCPKWLEYTLTAFGALALEGGPIKWVSTHRIHHAFSDRPSDPHSPTRGFWWAHMLWLFLWDDAIDDPKRYNQFALDLVRDPVHRFIEKTSYLYPFILGAILFVWGGFPFLVWGIFVRTAFVYHGTWLVNSAAHIWGYQTYNTNEGSTNNWWVALIAYGEGWHNNHHAYLHSAAHGLRWWELDITYFIIRLLKRLNLATQIHLPQGNPARLSIQPIPAA